MNKSLPQELQDLIRKADVIEAEGADLIETAGLIRKAIERGTKWSEVTEVPKTNGQAYVIRRVLHTGERLRPALGIWVNHRWKLRYLDVAPDVCSLEVWA